MPASKEKIVAVIQARLGSQRLPGKVLKKIQGRSLVGWIAYRLSFARQVDQVVLSTADNRQNDPLAKEAIKLKLPYCRGSETDLIQRLLKTALKFKADAIVRITADCPLVDPQLVDRLVSAFRHQPALEYVTNIFPPTFPDGLDVEILPAATLKRLNKEVRRPLYREWLTTTILENPWRFKIKNISRRPNLAGYRLTVDYPEDFLLVKKIISRLHREGQVFCLEDMLRLYEREPSLLKINRRWVDNEVINKIRMQAWQNLKSKKN